jgi:hypothetical protein
MHRVTDASDPRAVGIGGGVVVFAIVVSGIVPDLRGAAWVGALALVSTGLLGGFVAGAVAGGSRRTRVIHGLASGVVGGVAFGAVLWYTMTTPGAPEGVFYGISYIVATSGVLSPAMAARYDAVIPIALAGVGLVAFALGGAIGGGLVPEPSSAAS